MIDLNKTSIIYCKYGTKENSINVLPIIMFSLKHNKTINKTYN